MSLRLVACLSCMELHELLVADDRDPLECEPGQWVVLLRHGDTSAQLAELGLELQGGKLVRTAA